jgi:hypothetical protein
VFAKSTNVQIKCFAQAILQLKNYLNGQKISYTYFQSIDTSNFHPILQGRIYTIQLLSSGFYLDDLTQLIEKNSENNENAFLLDFFYEPITIAILSKNFELMNAIINFLSNKKNELKYYHEHHHNLYKLMEMFFLIHTSKLENKKINFKKNLIDLDFKYSYREFISFFSLIIKYQRENKKIIISNEFDEISKKINYPLLSIDYLFNYFK